MLRTSFSRSVCRSVVVATVGMTSVAIPSIATAQPAQPNHLGVTLDFVEWNAVSAAAADDVWTVGDEGFRIRTKASVASHWDGVHWTDMVVAGSGSRLADVSVLPGGEVWAVGVTNGKHGTTPLIEHWDGFSWSSQQAPGAALRLSAVSAVSPTDVWAVGFVDSGGSSHPRVVHWNGSVWKRVTTDADGNAGNVLTGVSLVSPTDGWAVGSTGSRRGLILHWDGASWSQVAAPGASGQVFPSAVDASSTADAWLVGSSSRGDIPAITQHWNGTAWRDVKGPKPDFAPTLDGVSSRTATDTWAVGSAQRDVHHSVTFVTVAEHWNGSAWQVVDSPNPNVRGGNVLHDVTTVSAEDAWAVGATDADADAHQALILHWDGSRWSVV